MPKTPSAGGKTKKAEIRKKLVRTTDIHEAMEILQFLPDGYYRDEIIAMLQGDFSVMPVDELKQIVDELIEVAKILDGLSYNNKRNIVAHIQELSIEQIKRLNVKSRHRRAIMDVRNYIRGGHDLYTGVSHTAMELKRVAHTLDVLLAITYYSIPEFVQK
jgi:hypothetical protein